MNTATAAATVTRTAHGAAAAVADPLHRKNEQKHILSTLSVYECVSHSL
jgi:hypothetical protein